MLHLWISERNTSTPLSCFPFSKIKPVFSVSKWGRFSDKLFCWELTEDRVCTTVCYSPVCLHLYQAKQMLLTFRKKTPFLSFSKEKHGFYELCRLVLVHLHYILIKIKKNKFQMITHAQCKQKATIVLCFYIRIILKWL